MIKKIIKLLLVVCWMGLIFSFSNDTGNASTKKSDGFIVKSIEIFLGRDLTLKEKENYIFYFVKSVRKGAHLGVYLILGGLVLTNLYEYIKNKRVGALLALFISFLYACSDEFHQLFINGRSGQVSDVLLDTIGAGLGILMVVILRKWKYEQKERIS